MHAKTLESGSYPAFNSVCFVVPATVDDDERIDALIATQVGDLTVLQTAKSAQRQCNRWGRQTKKRASPVSAFQNKEKY